ncbi:MAG: PadR family transcriptional regulator [Euzebya sp.]
MSDDAATSQALPRGYLRACLLLLLAQRPSHGYELIGRLADIGLTQADPGGVYRLLRVMQGEALIDSGWQTDPTHPPRRVYALRPGGLVALQRFHAELRRADQAVHTFMQQFDAVNITTE